MRVTDVSTIKLRYTVPVPMADAIHYMPERTVVLVRIATDTGLVGTGESAAYGGSLESMERIILDDLRPSLLGEDPFAVSRL
ncbi:MAG: mandelate racemase/muconate lactonizing enzyme family protein, partial [Chloroflexota bacterium]|nr:mandelate racemase/muconate lactonizing enzyme family protein [Chloroflexota bacterium]